jgi:probable HAF family extracellular repeat protein
MSRKFVSRHGSAVLLIVAFAAPATAVAAGPVPIAIGPRGAARAINDGGQVVGGHSPYADPAWLWKQGVGLTWLGAGGAHAINDSGMIVGTTHKGSLIAPAGDAFLWTQASGVVALGTLAGRYYTSTIANDINESRQIAGTIGDGSTRNPVEQAVMWTPDGWVALLGWLPERGGNSMAAAINDSGQVAGTSGQAGTSSEGGHAFLWTQAGGMVDLGTLPGATFSQATAINNHGQVVGISGTDYANRRAFMWTPTGGMVDLGGLPDATYSEANAINDRGQVVGGSGNRAFVWTQADGMVAIGAGTAYAINEHGQIAGTDGTHAVLWGGDTTRPAATLTRVRGQKLADVRSRGLRLQLTLSEPSSTEITLTRGKKHLATKTVDANKAGSIPVTFKLSHNTRVALRKLSKATSTLRAAARDLAGNSDITTTTLTIKR